MVYYYKIQDQEGGLVKEPIEGGEISWITEQDKSIIMYPYYIDNKLYYVTSMTQMSNRMDLYFKDENGIEKCLVKNVRNYNVKDDWIYYTSSREKGLFRISIDGNDQEKLLNDECTFICIYGENLYTTNQNGFIKYNISTKERADTFINQIND